MADPDYEFMDGFDKYGAVGTDIGGAFLTLGEWSSSNGMGSSSVSAALGGTGYALHGTPNGLADASDTLTKIFSTNYARCIGGITTTAPVGFSLSSGGATLMGLQDGSTSQMSIFLNTSGDLIVNRGATAIATVSAAFANSSEIACIEWDFWVHNTTGYAKVWKNGTQIVNFSGDTSNNANNYYDRIYVGANQSDIDHFYSWHYLVGGGSETPALTNPIITTEDISAKISADSTVGADVLGEDDDLVATATKTLNIAYFRKVVATVNGDITAIRWYCALSSATGKAKGALFTDSGGSPGTLLSSGTEKVGWTTGTWERLVLTTPQTVVAGTTYWLAILTDTTSSSGMYVSTSQTNIGASQSRTYSLDFPTTAGATLSNNAYSFLGEYDPTTVTDQSGPLRHALPTDLAYDVINAANLEDLYSVDPIPVNPTYIYSTAVKVFIEKTDTGVRTFQVETKSGTTTSSGNSPGGAQTPVGSGSWMSSYFHKDPDTGLDWTKSALDAAYAGYKSLT